jgi:hypothetical protein
LHDNDNLYCSSNSNSNIKIKRDVLSLVEC